MLQKDLDALLQWSKDWRMLFHPDKCKVMSITNKMDAAHPQLTMENNESTERHTLHYTEVERDLGIMISSNFKHVNCVKSTA